MYLCVCVCERMKTNFYIKFRGFFTVDLVGDNQLLILKRNGKVLMDFLLIVTLFTKSNFCPSTFYCRRDKKKYTSDCPSYCFVFSVLVIILDAIVIAFHLVLCIVVQEKMFTSRPVLAHMFQARVRNSIRVNMMA